MKSTTSTARTAPATAPVANTTTPATARKGSVIGTPFVAHERSCAHGSCTQRFWATQQRQTTCRTCTAKAAREAREAREREYERLAAIAARENLEASLKTAFLLGKKLPEGYEAARSGKQVVIKGLGISITFYTR